MKYSLIISAFFLVASCCKEELPAVQTNGQGQIIALPYLWKSSLHLSTPVSNSSIWQPIYYKGNIVVPVTNGENNRMLGMMNPNNGELIWTWDDRYQPATEHVDIAYYHQYNNLLTYQVGSRGYCINLDNGTTYWKNRRNRSFDVRISPYFGEYYFLFSDTLNSQGHFEQIAYLANINNGEISPFLSANFSSSFVSPTGGIGAISYINMLPGNDSLILVTYTEPLPNWNINSFWGLYNTKSKIWVYDRKLLATPTQNTSVFTPPQIYNGKVYANCGYTIVCHDLMSGNQIWSRDFGADFMFSGFIIAENKIIGSCENEILYCLDPATGDIIWQTKGSGTSTRLEYLNGIVYFIGGGDAKLHAVDVSTGKTVWLLDGEKIDGSVFASYRAIYVFPKSSDKPARIIATTLLNCLCFEAYR